MKSWPLRSQICSVGHPGSREILRETTVPIECYCMRAGLAVLLSVCILLLVFVVWHLRSTRLASQPSASATSTGKSSPGTTIPTTPESAPTAVYAHNLILRKGPDFRIYVRWLRGNMVRTRRDVNPTFDDPESFFLEIKTGVVRANIGDIGHFLNAGGVADSPLRNITLLADGDHIKLNGTLRKLISMAVELLEFKCTSQNSLF